MIAIIDYGVGNLRSVEKAFDYLGIHAVITDQYDLIEKADGMVLPGVGAFADAMGNLRKSGMEPYIMNAVEMGKPVLGICVGMQMMFECSDETDNTIMGLSYNDTVPGMGIFKGDVTRFKERDGFKIPQMGWNALSVSSRSRLLRGINSGSYFYFVHSYHVNAAVREEAVGWTEYTEVYPSVMEKGNVFATQFHPEKSGDAGLKVLKNFNEIIKGMW